MRTDLLLRASIRGLALFAAISLAAPMGSATIIGGGPPGPGLGGDDGAELFFPNLNPIYNRHIVLVKEAFDPVMASIPHSWGFYFAGDTSNRYPIFTSSDEAPPEQVAVIDFDNGQVVDLDTLAIDAVFTPSLADFGFYLEIEFPAGTLLTFSQAAENSGGVDTFASFPFLANPLFRLVAFEVDNQIYSLEIVDGAVPVPEPGVGILLGGGLALLAGRRRLRRA